MSRKPFYVTTPIYYVNDEPHIGHTYTTVVADTVARYRRATGWDVRFLTGTDEHGQKIERAAAKLGIEPIALADRVVSRYEALWKRMAISHDDFIRTTEARHRQGVDRLIEKMTDAGDVYLGSYDGMYCAGCEAFYPESQIVDGKCPDQGHPVVRGSGGVTVEVPALDAGAGPRFDEPPISAGILSLATVSQTALVQMYDGDAAHSMT